jgi:uncharacterized membrane protein
MKKSYLAVIFLIVLSFAIGFYFYPQLPEQAASHWNAQGEVNGYMSSFWAAFLMPIVLTVIFLFFVFIPKIDPLKENVVKFRKFFDGLIILTSFFIFYVYLLSLAWNLGKVFDMNLFIVPAMAALFFYCGIMVENAKRNWFIGIRNPWTISNDEVWDKTHKIGGKLFKAAGLLALIGLFFPDLSMFFILIPVILIVVFTTIYSYLQYRKLKF